MRRMKDMRPSVAYVETWEGERVECLLELVAPCQWQATPVRKVAREELSAASVDILPPKHSVAFVLEGDE